MNKQKTHTVHKVASLMLALVLAQPGFAGSLHQVPGSSEEVAAVVDQFLLNMQDDVRINHIFFENSPSEIRARLITALCNDERHNCNPAQSGAHSSEVMLPLMPSELGIVMQHLEKAAEHHYLSERIRHNVVEKLSAGIRLDKGQEHPLASL